ncbi:4'-phosphopantetheinyl transferase superfamily protein [Winogradskyella forsetii]|uniref:4'-phosphopantetheinyl transferase superfamily protein n=1 Tax=Winogradskyella forsetii TaxID=2686077 RepID=UPI0015C14F54|nr:4'-phosphopantetheinyl transferase superfamily protein [Winogradskyella forsetii]
MVGNDIVDLEEAKRASNWQRPRFLNKLFAPKEQQLIHSSENPFFMVWRLWSMKEAAYKLYTQQNPSRFYNPKGFECQIKNEEGSVRFKDFDCLIKTQITSKYILSEARLLDFKMTSKVIDFEERNPNIQSEVTKAALLNEFSKTYQISVDDLKIEKSEFGIPTVVFNTEKFQVSWSHHGGFGAYVV